MQWSGPLCLGGFHGVLRGSDFERTDRYFSRFATSEWGTSDESC